MPSLADVRVVAATHRDLAAAVRQGTFRHDLFYRLAVIALRIPPLRERRDDIPVLATAFLHKYAREFASPAIAFSQDALAHLVELPWDGNVRELENVVQRVAALAQSAVVTRADLEAGRFDAGGAPGTAGSPAPSGTGASYHDAKQRVVDGFERDYATALVCRHRGNLSAAAREAGLDRKSLSRLLLRHGLELGQLLGSEPPGAEQGQPPS